MHYFLQQSIDEHINYIKIDLLFEHIHQAQSDDEVQLDQDFICDDVFTQIELYGLHDCLHIFEKVILKIRFKQMQKFFNSITKQRKIMFNKKHRNGAFLYDNQYFHFVLFQ